MPLDETEKFSIDSNIEAGPKSRVFFSTGPSPVSLSEERRSIFTASSNFMEYTWILWKASNLREDGLSWREFHQFLTETIYWPTQEPMPLARIKMLSLDASPWDPNNPDYVPKGAVSCVKDYEKYLKGEQEGCRFGYHE